MVLGYNHILNFRVCDLHQNRKQLKVHYHEEPSPRDHLYPVSVCIYRRERAIVRHIKATPGPTKYNGIVHEKLQRGGGIQRKKKMMKNNRQETEIPGTSTGPARQKIENRAVIIQVEVEEDQDEERGVHPHLRGELVAMCAIGERWVYEGHPV